MDVSNSRESRERSFVPGRVPSIWRDENYDLNTLLLKVDMRI